MGNFIFLLLRVSFGLVGFCFTTKGFQSKWMGKKIRGLILLSSFKHITESSNVDTHGTFPRVHYASNFRDY